MTPKRITYTQDDDGCPDIQAGNILRSSRSMYVVLTARRINTRDGARRFALGVERIGDATPLAPSDYVFALVWHKRGRRTAK